MVPHERLGRKNNMVEQAGLIIACKQKLVKTLKYDATWKLLVIQSLSVTLN